MKIKLCDTMIYLEIDNPTKMTDADIQNINEYVKERKLRCAGCDKELNNDWIATVHRPKSAYNEATGKPSMDWTLWLLHAGRPECADKWLKKRKK